MQRLTASRITAVLAVVFAGQIACSEDDADTNPGGTSGDGGTNTGGSNTGGSNTGGTNAGGTNTGGGGGGGGSNTGGTNTGGSANAGGTSTGGSNTGGTSGAGGNNDPWSVHSESVTISSFDTPGEWSGGTIDNTLYREGTGSLRWDQSDQLCTGGTCRVIYDPSEPIDLSSGDLLSLWIHNDVASEPLERTGNDYSYYGKTAQDVIQITFVNTNNEWYGINYIPLDFTDWKRVVFSKESFVDVFDDPSLLDSIDLIWINVVDQYGTGITERTLHLDDFTVSDLPPLEVPARFLATFETGSFGPDVGVANVYQQNEDLSNHLMVDYATIVDNPAPSAVNPSSKVFMAHPSEGYVRSEYETNHFHADEKTYIYAWKEYFPQALFDGVDPDWWGMISLGQWKAGCEEYGDGTYTDYICWGGGIFNDRRSAVGTTTMEFRFRAEPDCYLVSDVPLEHGSWVSFATEVYWTTTSNGYYRVFRNGALIEERSGIKTMIDSFPGDNCAVISLGMGIYADWLDTGAGTIDYYLDDLAIFDVDDGIAMTSVLQWQGY